MVTGAAGGLGLATSKYLVSKGYTVFALDYNEAALSAINDPKIVPVTVDVSKDKSVLAAVEMVKKTTDSIAAIVNFAGILAMGSEIEIPASTLERILEINLVGMYRINKAFFDLYYKGRGRVINISSEYGVFQSSPFNGFYTMSKHAVEAYSDALRREFIYLDYAIPVIKIRPGAFKTNMQGSTDKMFAKICAETTHYKETLQKMDKLRQKGTQNARPAEELAKVIYQALVAKKPKLAYKANIEKGPAFLNRLPSRQQDAIYRKTLSR